MIGLQRGAFPRRVGEDSLLTDALRRALRDVLPDLPVKSEGHDEERFLFAQLTGAAPHVHLSCAERDVTGRATSASPLFERAAPEIVLEPEASSPGDALIAVARHGTRAEFAAALPAAKTAGVEVANLANNHSGDFGPAALLDSVERLRGSGIAPVGAGANAREASTAAVVATTVAAPASGATAGAADAVPIEAAATTPASQSARRPGVSRVFTVRPPRAPWRTPSCCPSSP